MKERRRYHRLGIQLPASLVSADKTKSVGTTIDLSGIGICLKSREKFDIGKELPIQITLPTNEKLTVYVKVIWVQQIEDSSNVEYKIGVKVVEPMKADELRFVKFYVDQFLDEFKDKDKL